MAQIAVPQELVLRFQDGGVQVLACQDPVHDIPDAPPPGAVELCKVRHGTFCANTASFQQYFKLSPATLEHLKAATRRSEFDSRAGYLLITLRYPVFDTEERAFRIYSMTLLVFPARLLVVIPDGEADLLDAACTELLEPGSPHRYQVAQLVTLVARTVFRVYTESLENFGDVLNQLEDDIIDSDSQAVFAMTTLVRKQNIFLQQTILPLKEMSFNMLHAESDIITPELDTSLHLLSDQIQRVMDSAGMLSQINSGLLDIYANSQANRMNEIMRTLTVFSVLTLPITVISGFYGMNFIFLPGLQWEFGVVATVGVMLVAIWLIFWFCRRKKII